MAEDGFADFVNVAAGRKVHHGVGAVVHGGVQLLQFLVDVGGDGGIADVGVDLAQRGHADAHGLQFRMVDVRRDDHPAAGDFVAHQFRSDLLALGDVDHLLGDLALAGIVHLGEIAVMIFGFATPQPFGAGPWNSGVAVGAISGRAIRGSHGLRNLTGSWISSIIRCTNDGCCPTLRWWGGQAFYRGDRGERPQREQRRGPWAGQKAHGCSRSDGLSV